MAYRLDPLETFASMKWNPRTLLIERMFDFSYVFVVAIALAPSTFYFYFTNMI